MFKRVRLRLTVVCAVSTSLVLVIMALASFAFSQAQLKTQFDESFVSSINSVLYHLRSQTLMSHTWLAQTEAEGNMYIGLYSPQGEPLMFTTLKAERLVLSQAARKAATQEGVDPDAPPENSLLADHYNFRFKVEGDEYRGAVSTVAVSEENYLSLALARPMEPENRQIAYLGLGFTGLTLLALALLCLFAWLFSKWAIQPAKEGHRRQAEFISAASHELRTPLSVILASAGVLKTANEADIPGFVDTVEAEGKRMGRLVEDLLYIAGADEGRWRLQPTLAQADTLLLSLYERYEPLFAKNGLALRVLLPEEAVPRVKMDAQRVEQLLAILLHNALSYVPEGGHVQLGLQSRAKGLAFTVADNGPGILPQDRERIFERFFRGDEARSEKQHFGLGLPIASEIAQLHGGSLKVGDAPGGGAVFTFYLPAKEQR